MIIAFCKIEVPFAEAYQKSWDLLYHAQTSGRAAAPPLGALCSVRTARDKAGPNFSDKLLQKEQSSLLGGRAA